MGFRIRLTERLFGSVIDTPASNHLPGKQATRWGFRVGHPASPPKLFALVRSLLTVRLILFLLTQIAGL